MKSIKQHNLRDCSVSITNGKDSCCMPFRWPQMAWHILVHTKFHDDRLKNSSNIEDITSTCEAVVLILLMRGISYAAQMISGGMIYIPSLMTIGSGITVIITSVWKDVTLVLLMEGIYELCLWDGLRCTDVHTKFHKDWFGHWQVNMGGYILRHTDGKVIS
jgi:hypothetical protein